MFLYTAEADAGHEALWWLSRVVTHLLSNQVGTELQPGSHCSWFFSSSASWVRCVAFQTNDREWLIKPF